DCAHDFECAQRHCYPDGITQLRESFYDRLNLHHVYRAVEQHEQRGQRSNDPSCPHRSVGNRLTSSHAIHDYFPLDAAWRRSRSSCARSSGVSASPKSSASKICRISTSPSVNGARFSHSMASAFDFTCHSQKPATSSLVSAKGPSMTEGDLP